tara:strand:- start:10101 stop:10454 length:354 start_codon:yes stop_codon:yes gene_type:complete
MTSKGLGDDIAKITKATGIKAVVDKIAEVTNTDCGCDKRQEKLNKWFPKRGSLRQDEYAFLDMFFATYNGNTLKSEQERDMLYAIYNRVNKAKEQPTSCPPCLQRLIDNLKKKYNEY